jgi:hypothetical protein
MQCSMMHLCWPSLLQLGMPVLVYTSKSAFECLFYIAGVFLLPYFSLTPCHHQTFAVGDPLQGTT